MSSIQDVLGAGGLVAARFPNFESRPQQTEMADAVADALAKKRKLLVEAGTGVGKSFAYLVPAIQAVAANKDLRIVVSTHTISLQEQLMNKDLPLLKAVGFSAVPPEAPDEVRAQVHYVAQKPAGFGAAREVCEFILRHRQAP